MPINYRHFIFTIPSSCPRDFYVSQGDKHSDLTVCKSKRRYGNGCCCGFTPRFPYPRAYRIAIFPTTNMARHIQIPCVYSFVTGIILQIYGFCNSFHEKNKRFLPLVSYNIGNCAWNMRNFACSNKVFLIQKRPKNGRFIACEVNFVLSL